MNSYYNDPISFDDRPSIGWMGECRVQVPQLNDDEDYEMEVVYNLREDFSQCEIVSTRVTKGFSDGYDYERDAAEAFLKALYSDKIEFV